MSKNRHAISVILAACLWGFMGFFRRKMGDMGLNTFGIILARCAFSALLYALTIALTKPVEFKIRPRDFWCFVGSGLCSLLFFSICYFQAMSLMTLSAAAILLYTAPCFVILLSALLFKERITGRKVFAMLLAFAGCCLTSGVVGSDIRISTVGILYGLGSGFGYALYSIFSRLALNRGYSSITISFWSCLLAGIGAALIFGFREPMGIIFSSAGNLLFCFAAAIISTYLPYLLYTYGLEGIEAGKASIMASVEPVVATLVGLFLFNEILSLWSVLGIILVLSAIVLLNSKTGDTKI